MATPQQNLSAAYPGAVDGDAVLDQATGDYWVKKSGTWVNVGQSLGQTIDITYAIIPYNETQYFTGITKAVLKINSYPRAFGNTITTVTLKVKTVASLRPVLVISVPAFTYTLQRYSPTRAVGDVYVQPIVTAIAIVPFTPADIYSSLALLSPVSIAINAYVPGTQANINVPDFAGVLLISSAPSVQTLPYAPITTINIQAFEPISIGGFLEIPATNVSIAAYQPTVVYTMPVTIISLNTYTPRVQVAVQAPTTFVYVIALTPDSGKGIIIPTTNIGTVAPIPSIDAYPVVDSTALYGRWILSWDQPEDTYQIYSSSEPDIDVDSILGFNRVWGIPSGSVQRDGDRSTAVVKWADSKYSGRFYLSNTDTTVNPRLQFADPALNPPERPWISSNQDATIFMPFANTAWYDPDTLQLQSFSRQQDFALEIWVYPLSESFTGTAESASRPLMCNNLWNGTTLYRGWDIVFRGTGSTGIVYVRANDQNFNTNPVAVVFTCSSTQNFTANQWNHVLWMRKNDQIAVAVNGVWGTVVNYSGYIGSITSYTSVQSGISTGLTYYTTNLGSFRSPAITNATITGETNRFSGYMDSIRFMKGLVPNYTLGTNFTPPATKFPYGIAKRTENNVSYYTSTSFYEQDMWLWWWNNEYTYDAQKMEEAVKVAVNKFIIGCKKDEIWQCFTDCYLFIGPRTINGLLNIALHGANPNEWHVDNSTGHNFVQSDYDRRTGLKGDGTSKWLRTPRVNNIFAQNNHHRAAWVSSVGTGPIFAGGVNQAGSTYVDWIPGYGGIRHGFTTNVKTVSGNDALTSSGGFVGFNRSNASNYQYIVPGASGIVNEASQAPWMEPVEILGASIEQSVNYAVVSRGTHRLAFYSHGSSLDLDKLKYRVTLLISQIQAAIP